MKPSSLLQLSQIFSQLLLKRGKKARAQRNFFVLLDLLKVHSQKEPMAALASYLSNLFPGVAIRKKLMAGRLYHLPVPCRFRRSLFQASHWLVKGAFQADRKHNLSVPQKLFNQLLCIQGRTPCLSQSFKDQFIALVRDNRPFLRFLRRKRKPFRLRRPFRRYRLRKPVTASRGLYFHRSFLHRFTAQKKRFFRC